MSQLQRSIPLWSLLISYLIVPDVVSTNFTMTNNCTYTVWPGIVSNSNVATPNSTSFALQQGETKATTAPSSWTGRIWGRTYCTQNSTRAFSRVTGDCGSGKLECSGNGATPPATLAEFTLDGPGDLDFYDVSVVDGYNLPILVTPQGRSAQNCSSTGCVVDLNESCPSELQVTSDKGGGVVACKSACDAFQQPLYCCSGNHSGSDACKPTLYSEFFKNACPAAYSYAYDDKTSTFTCSSSDYQITFCPSPTISSQPAFSPSPAIGSQSRDNTASEFSRNKKNKRRVVIGGAVGSVVVVFLLGLLLFLILRRKRAINPGKATEGSIMANGYRDLQNGTNNFLGKLHDTEKRIKDLIDSGDFDEEDKKSIDVHCFDFDSLVAATDDFSDANKQGKGGFGPVYKGRFPGGQEIAIKRMSSLCGQGLEEFKNEVLLIAKLQHRNLVRPLGYCIKADEKILVYEYLPNKSLDFFIFDENRNALLNLEVRFNIILGIARGLLYLHQDSSGYMSPEYALDGLFSVKSDIFSFGVVVLEILSGKKNTAYFKSEDVPSLLGYAWKLWREEKPLELMDENLSQSCKAFEFLKCMNVALLCIQDVPADRPNMSNVVVVVMLSSETETFPTPKQPALFASGSFTTSTVNRVLLSSSTIEDEKET